ncbi:MAG TPA: PEP/pyruvate-binding domain-containing protein [Aliidongia sp.]|nr:PEP/pyruvate-binding domain-containing protein [Aliidongia sp.]
MNLILAGASLLDPMRAGGKASALARLAEVASVPPFLVLAPDAFEPAGLRPEARAALMDRLPQLGPPPYAVRSSAVGEDGAALAHAGQFLTLLGINAADVPAAAHRVWQSGAAPEVAAYRAAVIRAEEDTGDPARVAVIVQRQLKPRAAGAAFSQDPMPGNTDRIAIAAVAGLADRLMVGEVDGDAYTVDRTGNLLSSRLENGEPVLGPADRQRVSALVLACERAVGCPQDIEWAIEAETLYLLQSRPITTLRPESGVPFLPNTALTIWDNSNIVESYPGLVSPLTFSFARHVYGHVYRALLRLLGVAPAEIAAHATALDNLLGRLHGRVYYNLLNWYRILALLPGFALNRRAMEEMMGVGEALPAEIADRLAPPVPTGLQRIGTYARLALVLLKLGLAAIGLPRRIRRFERRLAEALRAPVPPLGERPLSALADEYRRLEAALLARWDAPLVNDLICMIAFSLSRRTLGRWTGDAGLALHAELLVGQGDIVSAEPAQRIRAMGLTVAGEAELLARLANGEGPEQGHHPGLEAAIAAYLDRFGERCAEELKLESRTLHDDPAPLYRAIAAAARTRPGERRPAVSAADGLARLFVGQPIRRRLAVVLIDWAKARVRDRENLRLERTRLFGRVRTLMRAIGAQLAAARLLEQADDVFMLTLDEVLGAVEGGAASYDLKGLAALRRRELAEAAQVTDLPERIVLKGATAVGLRDIAPVSSAERGTDRMRAGLGCSPGLVRGRARVVRDAARDSVSPGEILVARHTDPGWIALFTNAAAIVVERGSLLSHSAIVARELGIPCVVQLKGATSWLADGDEIEVDGTTGRVTRSEGALDA